MTYTYDLNENGCLILRADDGDKALIRELRAAGHSDDVTEWSVLEGLMESSKLVWIDPQDIGALTEAPILGLWLGYANTLAAWGYMDYQIRSFLDDLLEKGEAVFTS